MPRSPARPRARVVLRVVLRLVQLYAALLLFTVSIALFLRSDLGNMPWDVLHQGVSRHTGYSLGAVMLATSFIVLLLWIPLKQRPGLGTVSNAVVIGVMIGPILARTPQPDSLGARVAFLVLGILTNAVGAAAYLAADFGPGPRDGLMTGLVQRTGRSVRLVKTTIELSLVLVGAALGGVLGVGTVVYALTIGPLVQLLLPFFEHGRGVSWRVSDEAAPRAAEDPDDSPGVIAR